MIHHGDGLALGLEAGEDLLGVHPGLDHLERDHARDGLALLGHPDGAEATLADLLAQGVGADDVAFGLGEGGVEGVGRNGGALVVGEEGIRLFGLNEEALDLEAELGIIAAGFGEKGLALLSREFVGAGEEVLGVRFHRHLRETRVTESEKGPSDREFFRFGRFGAANPPASPVTTPRRSGPRRARPWRSPSAA